MSLAGGAVLVFVFIVTQQAVSSRHYRFVNLSAYYQTLFCSTPHEVRELRIVRLVGSFRSFAEAGRKVVSARMCERRDNVIVDPQLIRVEA